MTEIKPRIDDGVPWCDAGCPQCDESNHCIIDCGCYLIENKHTRSTLICPHAVKRMAVELEAWRSGRLAKSHGAFCVVGVYNKGFDTIDDAVDALMAEREE